MTDAEWLSCTDPALMLTFLQCRANDRKLRLFASGCCRRIMHLLSDERSRNAVEVAEGCEDDTVNPDGLKLVAQNAGEAAEAAHWENRPGPMQTAAEAAAMVATETLSIKVATDLAQTVREALGDQATDDTWEDTWQTPGKTNQEQWERERAIYEAANSDEQLSQAAIIRDIFGNPFRPATIDPAWLTPNVIALAHAIYDGRAFARLPELADVLLDGRCNNENILNHCRSDEPHVRGCWVVDLVLGKESALVAGSMGMASSLENAKRVLADNQRVLYGIFGHINGSGYFPPREFLNEFLMGGSDPCDQDRRGYPWRPFAVSPEDYRQLLEWWVIDNEGTVEDSLGVECWNDWVQALFKSDRGADSLGGPRYYRTRRPILTPGIWSRVMGFLSSLFGRRQ